MLAELVTQLCMLKCSHFAGNAIGCGIFSVKHSFHDILSKMKTNKPIQNQTEQKTHKNKTTTKSTEQNKQKAKTAPQQTINSRRGKNRCEIKYTGFLFTLHAMSRNGVTGGNGTSTPQVKTFSTNASC